MFLRIDKLPVQLPQSKKIDPESAAAVQELMGGRFGEMSTFNNYFFQSINMRGKKQLGPYYQLVANIAAEELGHIQLVGAAINSLLNGPETDVVEDGDKYATGTPIADLASSLNFNPHHFIAAGRNALPVDSTGAPWNGTYVFSSGNLVLDLLHNFFLENSARTNKLRVYQMTKDPAAREMLGYLFVRGGVHRDAYAKAIEKLTGANLGKMLPIPKIGNAVFPEAKKYMDMGIHTKLYRYSPDDYREIGQIWEGPLPEGGNAEWVDAPPEHKGDHAELAGIGSAFAPDYHPQEIFEMAQKLYKMAKS
jgi:Mn-containing catalase